MLAPHTAAGGEGGGGGGAGNAAGGDTKPPAQEAPKVDPAELATLREKALKADSLEKELAKTQKAHKDFEARTKTPEYAQEFLRNALGMKAEQDPRKEIETLSTRATRAETVGQKAAVRAWALEKALGTDIKPGRVKVAVNNMDLSGVKFDAETGGIVDGDGVFDAQLAALRKDLPEVFAPAAGEKEPASPAPGSTKPPVVGQPQNKAPAGVAKVLNWAEFHALPVKEQKAYREAMAAARAGN